MIVADDQLQSMKPPDDRRLQELTPMHLRFRKLYTHAQHTAATTLRDSVRNQRGSVHHRIILKLYTHAQHTAATTLRDSVRNQRGSVHHRIILVTDFFIPGVQQQIFDGLRQ